MKDSKEDMSTNVDVEYRFLATP
ncbi:DUF2627 domain-containing protein [Candidatus Erwinia haradaeae]